MQQLLKGQEYTVMMAADINQSLHAVVPVRVGIKRGITLRAETDNNPIVIEGCVAIHETLPTVGCYNIQILLTNDDKVMPFEINPRISTTFCLGLAAGIDPVAIFTASSKPPARLIGFRNGMKLGRYWYNHFS